MAKRVRVTPFELEILRDLWEHDGGGTVTQILERWPSARPPGYTTVLKKLQVMEGKRLVTRRKQGRAHVYQARVGSAEVIRHRFQEILGTVFGGDRVRFAHAFLDDLPLTPKELREIRALIDRKTAEAEHGER